MCIRQGLQTLKNGTPSIRFLESELARQHGTVISTAGFKQTGITKIGDLGSDFLVEFPDGHKLWLAPHECLVIARGEHAAPNTAETPPSEDRPEKEQQPSVPKPANQAGREGI